MDEITKISNDKIDTFKKEIYEIKNAVKDDQDKPWWETVEDQRKGYVRYKEMIDNLITRQYDPLINQNDKLKLKIKEQKAYFSLQQEKIISLEADIDKCNKIINNVSNTQYLDQKTKINKQYNDLSLDNGVTFNNDMNIITTEIKNINEQYTGIIQNLKRQISDKSVTNLNSNEIGNDINEEKYDELLVMQNTLSEDNALKTTQLIEITLNQNNSQKFCDKMKKDRVSLEQLVYHQKEMISIQKSALNEKFYDYFNKDFMDKSCQTLNENVIESIFFDENKNQSALLTHAVEQNKLNFLKQKASGPFSNETIIFKNDSIDENEQLSKSGSKSTTHTPSVQKTDNNSHNNSYLYKNNLKKPLSNKSTARKKSPISGQYTPRAYTYR